MESTAEMAGGQARSGENVQAIGSLLQWAKFYASRGWRVHPLRPKDKRPVLLKWQERATTDAAQLELWWAENPDYNIGIACGAGSGLFVLDFDTEEAIAAFDRLCDEHSDLAGDPLEVKTGKGVHLYFRHTDGLGTGTKNVAELPGTDTRGEGGYVVAPPSIHPDPDLHGYRYSWTNPQRLTQPLVELPSWLLTSCRKDSRPKVERAEHAELPPARVVTREDIERYAAYAEREGKTREARVARLVLEGKSWGKPGVDRATAFFEFAGSLDTWFYLNHRHMIDRTELGLFDASCAAVNAEGVDELTGRSWVAKLLDKRAGWIVGRQKIEQDEAEALNLEDIFPTPPPPTARAIMRAFGSDRSEPYTPEELAAMHPIEKRWILHTDAGYFLRKPGDYEGPFTKEQLTVRARDTLAPASSAGVELTFKGKPKTTQALTREYGSVPGRTEFSLYAPTSALEGDVFVQRVARLRDIEPRFDPQIDAWLRLFGGKNAERLLDWIAAFTRLDEPCCGLIATGDSGSGKGLLVAGLARLFPSCGVMTFKEAVGPFNAGLCNAPIIFADEDLAVDYGQSAPDELKKAIDARERRVADKNQRAITLRGACRVIIAANNGRVIKFKRQLTEADIAALDARLLLVEPGQDAVDYLKSLGGIDTTNAWVRGDGLAAHALWLRDNRTVTPGARYLVEGQGDVMTLLSAQDIGANLFLRAVLDHLVRGANDELTVAVRDGGEVWVNELRLVNAWPAFLEKPDDMGTAKKTATVPNSSKAHKYEGVAVRQVLVRPEVLSRAAKSAGLEEMLAAALSR